MQSGYTVDGYGWKRQFLSSLRPASTTQRRHVRKDHTGAIILTYAIKQERTPQPVAYTKQSATTPYSFRHHQSTPIRLSPTATIITTQHSTNTCCQNAPQSHWHAAPPPPPGDPVRQWAQRKPNNAPAPSACRIRPRGKGGRSRMCTSDPFP